MHGADRVCLNWLVLDSHTLSIRTPPSEAAMSGEQPDLGSVDAKVEDSSTSPAMPEALAIADSTTAQQPEDPQVIASSSDVTPSSSNNEGSSAAVSSTPYGSLAYAPRQPSYRSIQTSRPISQSSALLDSGSSTPLPQPSKPVSNEPPVGGDSTDGDSTVIPTPSSALKDGQVPSSAQPPSTAPMTSALDKRKIDVQKALDECLAIGLGEASPGYALVKQLMEGNEGEWNALACLVGEGEATLLLPVATRSSSKGTPAGPHEPPNLAYAYDHVLLSPSARPSSSAHDFGDRGVATLSGLRGSIDTMPLNGETTSKKQKLVIKSFINRTDQSWSRELRNKDTRGQLLSRMAPLPQACCIDYPYPNYSLLAEQTIEIPGPSKRSRAVSGSSALTAPALGLGGSGPPASFASLFGGAGRDKRKSGVVSGSTSANSDEASDSTRKINVWLIDRPLRRSRALRGMTHSIQARLTVELKRRAAIDPAIGDLVGAFAAEFYPVLESSSSKSPPLASTSSSRSSSLRLSRSSAAAATTSQSASSSSLPLYTIHPDEITSRYQDLCSSVHGQLGGTVSDEAASALLDKMEVVEELLMGEIYDRLISPPQGSDQRANENLASRIAALNVLGLDWASLGLKLPKERSKTTDDQEAGASDASSSEAEEILTGLQTILEECQATLSNLEKERTPRAKLELLVVVHRSIVDGLAKLPKIELQGDVEQSDLKPHSNDPTRSSTPSQTGNTSSADLILPILIRLLVKASPPAICSQLLFLQRYRYEALLKSSGETAYCLINFQAAVQFIENAKPGELGLEGDMIGSQGNPASTSTLGRSAAMEMLKNVQQDDVRNNVSHNETVLIGTRIRGLTGVVNSSFSVLGRVMSSGASAGMDAWDRSSRMDTVRSLEDIRGLLSTGLTRSAASGSNLAKMLREKEQEGNQGEPTDPSPLQAQAPSSTRTAGAVPRPIAAKSSASASTAGEVPAPMGSPTSTRDPNKLSLSDRLARLNWNQNAGGTPGASSPAIEAPQPTHLVPSSVAMGANQRSFSGGTLNLPSGQGGSVVDDEETLPASLRSPYPPLSQPPTSERPLHVLLATSGSVASVKLPLIVKGLLQLENVRVQVVATKNSMHFYDPKEVTKLAASDNAKGESKQYTLHDLAEQNRLAALGQDDEALDSSSPARPPVHLWTDADEWSQFTKVGDPILHIELRRWADVVLIAPCSANTLAKISNGICDDLLTSLLRALSSSTPTWLFPAMNTLMYRHPLTARQLSLVQELLGYEVFGPIEKKLACGDLGKGAMYEWTDILGLVKDRFGLQQRDQETEVVASEVPAS